MGDIKVSELLEEVLSAIRCGESERACHAIAGRGLLQMCNRIGEHAGTDHETADGYQWPNIAPTDRERMTARIVAELVRCTSEGMAAVLAVVEACPKRDLSTVPAGEPLTLPRAVSRAMATALIGPDDSLEFIEAKVEASGVRCPVEREWMDAQIARSAPTAESEGGLSDVSSDAGPLLMCPMCVGKGEAPERVVWGAEHGGERVWLRAEEADREQTALRAEVARYTSSPEREAVDKAARKLGRVHMHPNSGAGAEERGELFEAMAVLFRTGDHAVKAPVVNARASSPETINGRAEADREALERAGDVLAKVHEHDRVDALRAGLQAAGEVLAEGWKRGEYGEALMARAQEARDAEVLRVGAVRQKARERAIEKQRALMPGEPADEAQARRAAEKARADLARDRHFGGRS